MNKLALFREKHISWCLHNGFHYMFRININPDLTRFLFVPVKKLDFDNKRKLKFWDLKGKEDINALKSLMSEGGSIKYFFKYPSKWKTFEKTKVKNSSQRSFNQITASRVTLLLMSPNLSYQLR